MGMGWFSTMTRVGLSLGVGDLPFQLGSVTVVTRVQARAEDWVTSPTRTPIARCTSAGAAGAVPASNTAAGRYHVLIIRKVSSLDRASHPRKMTIPPADQKSPVIGRPSSFAAR